MEVYGKVPGQPEVATYGLRNTANDTEESHSYIDENGVVRQKKGVYYYATTQKGSLNQGSLFILKKITFNRVSES